MIDGEKVCNRCRVNKPVVAYYVVKGRLRGPCKDCWKAELARPRVQTRDRDSKFAANLRANYGMTVEDYDAMWLAQRGQCAICGRASSLRGQGRGSQRLAVDHDHGTGAVRGLLCGMCNGGLGLFDDDPARLRLAIEYLHGRKDGATVGKGIGLT